MRVGVFDTRFLTLYESCSPDIHTYTHLFEKFQYAYDSHPDGGLCGGSFGHLEKFPVEEHEVLSSIYGPDFEVGTRSSGEKTPVTKVKD